MQSAFLTMARLLGLGTTFLIPIVLVRFLSQADFGVYKQLFLVAGTLVPILSGGFGASLHYFIPREGGKGQRFVLQALFTSGVTGIIAAGTLSLGSTAIADWLNSPELAGYLDLIALYVLFATPGELVNIVPIADRRSILASYTIAGGEVLRAIAIVGSALMFGSVEAIVLAASAAALFRVAWLFVYVGFRGAGDPKRPTLAHYAKQLRYSAPYAVAIVLKVGFARFHEYYVAANVSAETFAVYALGVMNIPIFSLIIYSVGEVVLVRASVLYRDRRFDELRRLWNVALTRIAAALLPLWAVLEIFAGDIYLILFGPDYLDSVPIFRIFLTASLLLIIIDHGVLRATGDTFYIAVANAAGLLATGLAVVFFSRFSLLLGAAGGYVVGLMVIRGMGLAKVMTRLELPLQNALPWQSLAKVTMCVASAAVLASSSFLLTPGPLRLILGGTLFMLLYGALAQRLELLPSRFFRQMLSSI